MKIIDEYSRKISIRSYRKHKIREILTGVGYVFSAGYRLRIGFYPLLLNILCQSGSELCSYVGGRAFWPRGFLAVFLAKEKIA